MIFYCFAIDYKRTKLFLREKAYKERDEIVRFFKDNSARADVLFTCNRVEIYGLSESSRKIKSLINLFKERFTGVFDKAYLLQGKIKVIQHALELACGLHSQIVGEKQIMQQLDSWLKRDSVLSPVKVLWHQVLDSAHRIRAKLGIDKNENNIAGIILEDVALKGRFSEEKHVFVIGTGKIAELFSKQHLKNITVHFVSRKRQKRARQLARSSGGNVYLLDDLPGLISLASAVVSATASSHYLLRKKHITRTLARRQEPLYLYDLAVPRDIDPAITRLEGVVLKNLDDLDEIFKVHNVRLHGFRKTAEILIERYAKVVQEEINELLSQSGYTPQQACVKAG